MATSPTSAVEDSTAGAIRALLPSWRRSLAARRVSPRTIATYQTSAEQLAAFLARQGMPSEVARVRREHVEAFVEDLLRTRKPATAHNRYRGCQAFFAWCVEEGEVKASPMERMRPPKLDEAPPPVLREGDLRRLLEAAERDRTFGGVRDAAILRLFVDTGIRRGELLGMRAADVDLDEGLADVDGKTGKRRVAIGDTTIRALDRYMRARAKRPDAGEPWLWLGRKGRLRETGLAKLVRDRCEAAGLDGVHPHLFRHAYAHSMLSAGMQETDLMEVAGWRSREMVARYAKSTRAERARKVARSLSPADRLAQDGKR
ncbi:MAG: tyrosine-type recombinase/integrase [Chloroflexota bacterium]